MEEKKVPLAKVIRLDNGEQSYISLTFTDGVVAIQQGSPNWEMAVDAIRNEDWDTYVSLAKPAKSVADWIEGDLTISGGEVLFKGEPVHGKVVSTILKHIEQKLDPKYLMRFLAKVKRNPSMNSQDQLFDFLEAIGLSITESGDALGYKVIRDDWYSISADRRTGKHVFNGIGEVVKMPRAEVDDNFNNECSAGLHIGSADYIRWYSSRTGKPRYILVEFNPEHAVSVPRDHNFQKLRVCEYKVVGEYTGPLPESVYPSHYKESDYDDYSDEEDEEVCQCCGQEL